MIPGQLTIDEAPTARASDPDTSHQAGARASLTAGQGRAAALNALAHAHLHAAHLCPHGLTDFELAVILDSQQTSCGKRRGELVKLGYVAATEHRRPSPSGSPAIVWMITPAGITAWREATA